jgi:glucose/arabinose dehydrogenase
MNKQFFLSLLITLLSLSSIQAQLTLQNAFPNLTFSSPVFLTHAGDNTDRIFVVEQPGRIKVFPNSSSATDAKTFLDITDRVAYTGEMGLLGLAFHPDYANNGYFYVNYTADNPLRTIIARFQVTSNPDSADNNSEFQILTFSQPYQNHNGGWISFRPTDGYLYIGTGDGGNAGDPQNNGQSITTLLGKILRIDVDGGTPYTIPTTNPFYDSTGNVMREIYAWGMRNPWRCSFDPVTDWFWAGDVGQGAWEEIDIINNGKNYCWRCYEGNHSYNLSGCNYPEYIFPIWEYGHGPECSITGGYVYRGANVPELVGKYIYGDYCSNKIWSLEYDGINPPTNTYLLTATGPLTSFGVDQQNELYLTSFNGNGRIYRFTPTVTGTESEITPSGYSLEQNYPNPFNPSTMIRYSIPEESNVTIKVFNLLGKEVDTIANGVQQRGFYEKTWNAERFSSGVYYVKMIAQSLSSDKIYSNVIKMVYLK